MRGLTEIRTRARLWALGFVLLALPPGLLLAVRVPPGQVADEPNHIMRAYGLAHGELIGHREAVLAADGRASPQALLWTDPALAAVMTLPPIRLPGEPRSFTPDLLAAARAVAWNPQLVPVRLGSIAGYFPLLYAPAAGALSVARWLGATPYDAFLTARLANLLAFVLLGATSLLVARRGTPLLFTVLVLPMTLGLAASASQDGLLIAGTVLAVAMLSRAAEQAGAISRTWWYRSAAVLIAAVAATKPPYLPLAALLLLPLQWRGAGRADLHRRAGAMVLACVPALLWAWAAADIAAVPRDAPAYEAGPLWPGPRPASFAASDPAAQLHVLLSPPWRLLTVPLDTLWHHKIALAAQMVGVLGWLNCLLPRWLYVAWLAALPAAVLADAADADAPPPPRGQAWAEALLLVVAAAVSVLGILLALYLTWSLVGAPLVEGVQGRYLLPLLPMLGRAVPVVSRGRGLRWLALAPLAVAALDVVALPHLVTEWFYQP